MKFIHFTDTHLPARGERLWGLDPWARLEACLDDIERYHSDAAFCVITGDLVERGGRSVYEALRKRLADFPLETHVILGNHDDRSDFLAVFRSGSAGYAQSFFEREGSRFLFLDTLKGPPSSAGLYDAQRRSWLAAELAKANGAPVHIFMHHPPFDIGHQLMDLIKLEESETFAEVLKGHNVRHIYFGHAHRPISGQWRGIPFSALPGLNHQLPLVGGSVATIYSEEPPMYAVVLVESDRTIVHADAFLHRAPARMPVDAERDNWF